MCCNYNSAPSVCKFEKIDLFWFDSKLSGKNVFIYPDFNWNWDFIVNEIFIVYWSMKINQNANWWKSRLCVVMKTHYKITSFWKTSFWINKDSLNAWFGLQIRQSISADADEIDLDIVYRGTKCTRHVGKMEYIYFLVNYV